MQTTIQDKQILDRIQEKLRKQYNMRVENAAPIARGLLNLKWRLETNKGAWFVKCYSTERYGKHGARVWEEIEHALTKQAELQALDGLCPNLLEPAEGESYMQRTPEGDRFVVMELCEGRLIEAGTMSAGQMYSLGRAAARMHRAWNDAGVQAQGDSTLKPLWPLSREQMEQTWEERWAHAAESGSAGVRSAMQLQLDIIRALRDEDLAEGSPGWTHLDLWADNLLFHDRALSAVVDFDRVRYAYPRLDLGRAVLSCTLREGTFCEEPIAAFAEGYRCVRPDELPRGGLLSAVRHVWCVESFWWIHAGMESFSVAPARFASEMVDTAKQWEALEAILGGV